MDSSPSRLKLWIFRLLFPLFILILVLLVVLNAQSLWAFFSDQEKIRAALKNWGLAAPVFFMVLQFIQVVVFIIPGEIVQIAGGYFFGILWGSLYSVVGIALGASTCFFISRLLGVGFVHAIAGPENVRKFDHLMASPKLVGSFFLLFLIPGLPKDVLCYVAGLTRMRFFVFIGISTLARLPGILGSSLMGKAFADGNFFLLITVVVLASLLFLMGWKFRQQIMSFIGKYAIGPSQEEQERP